MKKKREFSKESKIRRRINFSNKIKEKFDNNVKVLGDYIDYDTPIQFKCVIHNKIYTAKPKHMLKRKFPCQKCKQIWQRNGVEVQKCEVCGSEKKTFKRVSSGKVLCKRHHEMFEKYGELNRAISGDSNTFEIFSDYAIMHIYNNKGLRIKDVKIDIEDIEKLKPFSWHITTQDYVETQAFKKPEILHRFLMNCPKDKIVDHINRDVLDCRKSNLRICTQTNNNWNASLRKDNTTGVRGVYIDKRNLNKPFKAHIQVNKKLINLGNYSNLEEAKKIRREAEKKYYNEFAPEWGGDD